jgi:hypothetical protein
MHFNSHITFFDERIQFDRSGSSWVVAFSYFGIPIDGFGAAKFDHWMV